MTDGQLRAVENHLAVHVGHGYLCRGNEEGVLVHLVGVVLKLGQLAGAGHGGAGHHVGGIDLVIAVFHVGVEVKVDDGTLQPRAQPTVEGKARAGHLGGGVKIQNAKIGADVPMRLRRPAELTRRAPAALFDVVVIVLAQRHALVGEVGQGHQESVHRGFQLGDVRIEGGDLVAYLAHFLHDAGHFLRGTAPLFDLADLFALGIAQGLLFLHLRHQGAALLVLGEKLVDGNILVARLERVAQLLGILPNPFDVQHGWVASLYEFLPVRKTPLTAAQCSRRDGGDAFLRGATRLKAFAFTLMRCIGRARAAPRHMARMTEQAAAAAALHRTAALLRRRGGHDHGPCHGVYYTRIYTL